MIWWRKNITTPQLAFVVHSKWHVKLYDGEGGPILWILYKIEMFDYLQTYYGCSISVVDQNFHTPKEKIVVLFFYYFNL